MVCDSTDVCFDRFVAEIVDHPERRGQTNSARIIRSTAIFELPCAARHPKLLQRHTFRRFKHLSPIPLQWIHRHVTSDRSSQSIPDFAADVQKSGAKWRI